jgi:hypothetical protein
MRYLKAFGMVFAVIVISTVVRQGLIALATDC